jgi:predicted GNAT family N-acyltransferase
MIENEWITGNGDLTAVHAIREKVFVKEQKIDPQRVRDAFDEQAVHLLIFVDGEPVATGRIYHDGTHFGIGRICVLKEYRGQGIGDLAVRLLLYKAFHYANEVHIHAQQYLEAFYAKFGFEAEGKPYLRGDIPHIDMVLTKEKCVFPSACGKEETES